MLSKMNSPSSENLAKVKWRSNKNVDSPLYSKDQRYATLRRVSVLQPDNGLSEKTTEVNQFKKTGSLMRSSVMGWTNSLDNLMDAGRHASKTLRRKQSRISNCNYFTLLIQLSVENEIIQKVTFNKSQTFKHIVREALKMHNIDVNDVCFSMDGSTIALPLTTALNLISGSLIIVTYKEAEPFGRNSRKSEKRNSASGTNSDTSPTPVTIRRPTVPSQLLSRPISIVEGSPSSPSISSGSQRFFFRNRTTSLASLLTTKDRSDRLNTQLTNFSSSGLPPVPFHILQEVVEVPEHLLQLENTWEDIVTDAPTLSIREQKQQAAIWEMLQTEVNFLNQIRSIIDVHLATFHELHTDTFCDVDPSKVFSNLDQVFHANCFFWKEFLSTPLQETRDTGEMLNPSHFKEAFLRVKDLLFPYTRFCIEMSQCRQFIQKLEKDNILFATFLQWTSNVNSTNRESLCDQLAKPFQRLTKYRPVLESIKKYTCDNEQIRDLEEMISSVSELVQEVNDSMHLSEVKSRLDVLDNRIEAYDVIPESLLNDDVTKRYVADFSHFSLVQSDPSHIFSSPAKECHTAFRQVLHEGSIKIKEGQSKFSDVTCFLFSDMFLVTKLSKKSSDKLKIVKSPVRLDKLVVRGAATSTGSFLCLVLNDFKSIASLFTFSTDPARAEEWVTKIKDAKKLYRRSQGYDSISLHDEEDLIADTDLDIPTVHVTSSSPRVSRTVPDNVAIDLAACIATHTPPPVSMQNSLQSFHSVPPACYEHRKSPSSPASMRDRSVTLPSSNDDHLNSDWLPSNNDADAACTLTRSPVILRGSRRISITSMGDSTRVRSISNTNLRRQSLAVSCYDNPATTPTDEPPVIATPPHHPIPKLLLTTQYNNTINDVTERGPRLQVSRHFLSPDQANFGLEANRRASSLSDLSLLKAEANIHDPEDSDSSSGSDSPPRQNIVINASTNNRKGGPDDVTNGPTTEIIFV